MKFFIISFLFLFFVTGIQSDWIYWKSEYLALESQKKIVEKELAECRKKGKLELDSKNIETNECSQKLSLLEGKFKDIESKYFSLEKSCETASLDFQERNNLNEAKIKELEDTIEALNFQREDYLKKREVRNEKIKSIITKLKLRSKKYKSEAINIKSDCEFEKNKLLTELDDLKKLTGNQKEQLERLQNQFNDLESRLANEIKGGMIQIRKTQNRLTINLDERISYASGSTVLKNEVKPILDKIILILIQYPENLISIEGHTDDIPIKTNRIRDNWQLSTERALSVLKYILENPKLDPRRCSAAGFGEYRPILPNSSNENRSLNRRVEIVILNP